jgi:hypothetical protein
MNSVPSLLIIAVMTSLTVACDRTVTLQIPVDENLELEIHRYDSTGSLGERCEIEAGSSEIARVADWLDGHRSGWEPSVVTYAPRVVIRGSDFTLNFIDDLTILNNDEGQFIHAVDPRIYADLKCQS